MGSMVFSRRNSSQAVSLGDRDDASRTAGRLRGQSTAPGAYPPVGESDAALFHRTEPSADRGASEPGTITVSEDSHHRTDATTTTTTSTYHGSRSTAQRMRAMANGQYDTSSWVRIGPAGLNSRRRTIMEVKKRKTVVGEMMTKTGGWRGNANLRMMMMMTLVSGRIVVVICTPYRI